MKPTFVFSVDVEGLWGVFFVDKYRDDLVSAAAAREAVPGLLERLGTRGIPATFAVVGHLFLEGCESDGPVPHPEMPRPRPEWWPRDWYAHDPRTDESSDPDWYGRSLVEAIRDAEGGHEIASHGFSHAIVNEDECGEDVARAELRETRRVAAKMGIDLVSHVFPQNVVGHRGVLADEGFRCFRAPDGGITQRGGPPGGVHRAARFARHVAGSEPPVGLPREVDGVVEIPSSLPIIGGEGPRSLVSRSARRKRSRRGLDAALREGAVFHLWTHPHAFAHRPDTIWGSFEDTLDDVARLRDAGEIQVLTMIGLADQFRMSDGR